MMMKTSFPQRTCIGCRNKFDQPDLLRISFWKDRLTLDKTGRDNGRGVYLCKNYDCLADAIKKNALNRSFKRSFSKEDIDILETEIKLYIKCLERDEYIEIENDKDNDRICDTSVFNNDDYVDKPSGKICDNKVYKYLGFAARARKLSVGATAAEQSIKKSKAKLIIIGEEVGKNTRAKLKPLCDKNNLQLFTYGSCKMLSRATGREDKGIFAVEDENLAKAIIETIDKEKEEY
ncbi:DUF448 domain-containing protein [Anaerovoracaceae bacterium SGI.195]